MSRTVPEWVGKTDDTPVPNPVRIRVFDRYDGRCQCGCRKEEGGTKIIGKWHVDHEIALCNGGENRESNLVPVLVDHHKLKTAKDVQIKSKVYRVRVRHLGLAKSKRPMPHGRDSKTRKTFYNGVKPRERRSPPGACEQ